MKFGPSQRARPEDVTERTAKAQASTQEGLKRAEFDMMRLERSMNRCRCGHSEAVHEGKVCQMDCECVRYRRR